jgi:hypothetical protein
VKDGEKLFRALDGIMSSRPFDRAGVSQAIGMDLSEDAEQANEYLAIYRGGAATHPLFSEVELRVGKLDSEMRDGIVILKVQPRWVVFQDEVQTRYGCRVPRFPPPRRITPGSSAYLVYPSDWCILRFGFERRAPERLTTVVIDASGR